MSAYNKLLEEREYITKRLKAIDDKLKRIDSCLSRYHRPIGNYETKNKK